MSRLLEWLNNPKRKAAMSKASRINELVRQAMNPQEVIEEGGWQPYNNKIDYRVDNRPQEQGGLQVHMRDRSGRESALRSDGSRSEPNKYKAPTNDMRNAALDILKKRGYENVTIESHVTNFEDEILYETFEIKIK